MPRFRSTLAAPAGGCSDPSTSQYGVSGCYAVEFTAKLVARMLAKHLSVRIELFNLLISGNTTAWETDLLMRMDAGRFKEYSGTESQVIAADKPESLKGLEEIPCLLLYECGTEGPTADRVRYGFLRDIRLVNKELQFRFNEEGVVPREVVKEFAERLGLSDWERGRTHWAIKDGGIPTGLLERLQPRYDVVLSFAGEDRPYVDQVAQCLRSHGVKVFYDVYEEAALWGKDLVEHFDMVYRKSGRYCVIFISEHYLRKVWTKQERQFALARALQERKEYILPARFDDTEIPGIAPTIGYISLAGRAPEEFARLIVRKLRSATPLKL
jgi:hypothetical protein